MKIEIENKYITLVSFETAMLAYTLGYPQENMTYCYNNEGELCITVNYKMKQLFSNENIPFYVVPTQCELQKWLIENYDLLVNVSVENNPYDNNNLIEYSADVLSLKYGIRELDGFTIYKNYFEAFEEGLMETLRLVKTNPEKYIKN